MLNQSALQTSRLGKSSSVKNNLGLTLGVDTPISFDSVRTSKIFPKNTLNLKQMLPRTTIAMEINQSPFSFGPQRTSRASIRNKSEDRKKEVYVASSAKLSDKGSEYSNGRESTTRELRNLHLNIKDNCNYASLLMYIPDDMQPLSARPSKKAFSSFKELVKTSRGGYDELLEDIVIQDNYLKNRNLAPIQKELDQIGVVRKVLEYNKSQKNQYVKQMEQQNQDMLLPTLRKPQLSSRQAIRVKIMPSKKLDDKDPATKFKHKIFNADEVMEKALHYKSTPASPLHSNRRRDSKVRRVSIQKLEDKTIERMFSVYNYKIFWSPNFTNSSAWKPGVREGHTFTTVGRYVILYGGVSNTLLEDIVFYDPTTNTWIKPKVTGEIPMGGRHGHTACEFKRNLIVFGGEHHFNSTLNIRECLNDIRMFSPETTEWRYIRSLNTSITPRRYHAATLCDHTMFVYGGINNEGVYMKDVWTFSLKSFMWTKAEFPGDREPGIAFHGMAACFVERSGIQTAKDKERIHSFEEGFYVFGGKDGDGQILSSLKMFTADLKNTQWKYPTVKGNPPVARYNHSTLFYEPLGLLVIYGGKNETLFGSTHDYCLNDIKILHLEQMFWAETTSFGHRPQVGRYHHSVASFGTKMLVFGGVELYHYADDEVKFVELNQVKARRLIETDDTAQNNGGRKSQGGALAGLMGDDFAREELQVFEEFYSKELVSWQPLPQAQLNYPEGETEIRLKLIENIQHREKNPNSPRKFVRQFTTIVMDDKLI